MAALGKRVLQMRISDLPQARLLNSLPEDRYRILTGKAVPPKIGDVVTLDQGFASPDGKPMVLAYFIAEDGSLLYEAEVYESELG